jgi:hypothetical protein
MEINVEIVEEWGSELQGVATRCGKRLFLFNFSYSASGSGG